MPSAFNRNTLQRVIVYGMPRSGTTIMQTAISRRFDLAYLGEIHASAEDTERSRSKIATYSRWCVKFLTNSVGHGLVDHVAALDPQCIVLMSRECLTDHVCSMHIARLIGIWHHRSSFPWHTLKPIIIPRETVISWINFVLFPYLRDLENISQWVIEKRWYTLEYIEAGGEIELANHRFFIDRSSSDTVASGIDYSKCVLNYEEIHKMISDPNPFRARSLNH